MYKITSAISKTLWFYGWLCAGLFLIITLRLPGKQQKKYLTILLKVISTKGWGAAAIDQTSPRSISKAYLCKSGEIGNILLCCSEQNLVWKLHTWEAVAATAESWCSPHMLTWCKHIGLSQNGKLKCSLKIIKKQLWCHLWQTLDYLFWMIKAKAYTVFFNDYEIKICVFLKLI